MEKKGLDNQERISIEKEKMIGRGNKKKYRETKMIKKS